MTRTPYVDKSGLRKGPWSKEEDDKLRAYIERYGHWNWREIPRFAGLSRCGKSCRLRWMNYLRPNIKHGNFTKQEEDLIMEIHNKIGNKWAKIAAELPGRSDNEIKNYWHTHLKKRVKNNQDDPKNINHDTKSQTNFINSSGKSLELSFASTNEHDPCVTTSSTSPPSSSSWSTSCSTSVDQLTSLTASETLISSDEGIQTYIDEYDDGNFWTDPFFADLDAVKTVVIAPSESDEFMWSCMDLYYEYDHNQFMI